jgi:hypothetical protein
MATAPASNGVGLAKGRTAVLLSGWALLEGRRRARSPATGVAWLGADGADNGDRPRSRSTFIVVADMGRYISQHP